MRLNFIMPCRSDDSIPVLLGRARWNFIYKFAALTRRHAAYNILIWNCECQGSNSYTRNPKVVASLFRVSIVNNHNGINQIFLASHDDRFLSRRHSGWPPDRHDHPLVLPRLVVTISLIVAFIYFAIN